MPSDVTTAVVNARPPVRFISIVTMLSGTQPSPVTDTSLPMATVAGSSDMLGWVTVNVPVPGTVMSLVGAGVIHDQRNVDVAIGGVVRHGDTGGRYAARAIQDNSRVEGVLASHQDGVRIDCATGKCNCRPTAGCWCLWARWWGSP